MTPAAVKHYVFDEFLLEPEKRTLVRLGDCSQVRLARRPFQVLLYLIENRERFVMRDELLDKLWDGRDVYDTALTKAVGAVRKALDEHPENPRYIETRWAEGYRFIGNLEERLTYLEIERTREVKIVIEEQSEPAAGAGDATNGFVRPAIVPTNHRQLFAMGFALRFAAIGCVAVLLALGAFSLFQNRSLQSNDEPIGSIAVLPLKNLSQNANSEIFSDGMTESLIASLSKIDGVKVISHNSVLAFKNRLANPSEIAERLGVETYLEGSVRENGERIRVDVRLVNAKSGEILWSGDGYDRTVGDILEIQDDIARSVATRLRLKLTQTEEQRLTRRQTSSVDAYQAYVKGRHFWKKKDRENLERAREFFEEAVRLDPNYALPYAGLADYYLTGIWYADFVSDAATQNAKAAAAKVMEIDGELPEAHHARARVAEAEWDWETHRKEIEKALELNPNEANYWQSYAFILRNRSGQFDEALTAIKRAQELDPLSVSINTDVGVMLTHAGRLDEAIEILNKTLKTDPQFFDAYWNLGLTFERKGETDRAAAAFIESERLKGESTDRLSAYRAAYEQGGMQGFWQKWLEFLLADSSERNVPLYVIAAWQARAGQNGAALEWLERSYVAREPHLVNLKSEYAFEPLRSDRRFGHLVRRVGL